MLFKNRICLLFILLNLLKFNFGAKYPSSLPRCKAGDTDCLMDVITKIVQSGGKGIKDINLIPIDPLNVDSMRIKQGHDNPVNVEINFKKFQIHGFSQLYATKVVGFDADPTTSKFELYGKGKSSITVAGPYEIKGQVLILPIVGKGVCNITLVDPELSMKFTTKTITRNGHDYIQIDKSKLDFQQTKVEIYFSNLFNGDKLLGDTTNRFLNENWEDIYKEIKPAFVEAIGKVVETVINNVFTKIPYKDAFLEE